MNNILELIPQREPMVMVDEFLGMGEAVSKTRFTVREDNLFVDNDKAYEVAADEVRVNWPGFGMEENF